RRLQGRRGAHARRVGRRRLAARGPGGPEALPGRAGGLGRPRRASTPTARERRPGNGGSATARGPRAGWLGRLRRLGGGLGAAPGTARLQRQAVDELVLRVTGVAAGPGPLDLVAGRQLQQALPQVAVLHRLPGGRAPAVPLPALEPTVGERLLQVLAVGHERDAAGPLQRLEGAHGGRELHAVVRRAGLEAGGAAPVAAGDEEVRPSAAARAGVARPVGVGHDAVGRGAAHVRPSSTRSGGSRRSSTTTAAAWSSAWESETCATSPSSSIALARPGLALSTGRGPSLTTHTSRQPRDVGHTFANASLAAKRTARPG